MWFDLKYDKAKVSEIRPAFCPHNLDTFIMIITEVSLLKTTTYCERIFLCCSNIHGLEKIYPIYIFRRSLVLIDNFSNFFSCIVATRQNGRKSPAQTVIAN